ncbi:hypothetical protein L6452_40435 [Arctium lappa]|uniref:Uncharacterized protein n=1 Tax=Arctium lappa TaxID=4217 RepID=A0ACB8XMA0_ARCLA|nr:hypothetical protein L6452_40435 [Arctium lappa]
MASSTIVGISSSVNNLSSKADSQNALPQDILTQLRNLPQPSALFTTEDRKTLQMVVKFDLLVGEGEKEKNAEEPTPQAEGDPTIEKGLVLTDEDEKDESTFIPIITTLRTEPTQVTTKAEDNSVEDDEEDDDDDDDEALNIDDDGKDIEDDDDDGAVAEMGHFHENVLLICASTAGSKTFYVYVLFSSSPNGGEDEDGRFWVAKNRDGEMRETISYVLWGW